MDAAAFWIAIALIIVALILVRSRSEQLKHETIRRIVEKTGQVDEEQLRKLFQTHNHGQNHSWAQVPEPGYGYRALRILGVLTLVAAASLAAFAGVMITTAPSLGGAEGVRFADDLWPLFPLAVGIAIFGCGLFYCSRFLPKPLPGVSARDDRS